MFIEHRCPARFPGGGFDLWFLGFLGLSTLDRRLTPRRGETLAILRRLAAERGAGVHYSEVAEAMGISAWTAYGLLRELERAGLAARSYAVAASPRESGNRGGRSRILFSPAGIALPAMELVERLRRALEQFSAIADESVAARLYLAETLQGAGGDVGLHLGFWMARLDAAGRSASDAVRGVLESGAVPAAKIQTLAGMGLGSVLSRLDRARLADRVVATVTRLSSLVEEAQRSSDTALATLVEEARGFHAGAHPGRPMRS
jgi:IclR helix-turn-helix domain